MRVNAIVASTRCARGIGSAPLATGTSASGARRSGSGDPQPRGTGTRPPLGWVGRFRPRLPFLAPLPTRSPMPTGKVKFYDDEKGFGFISQR